LRQAFARFARGKRIDRGTLAAYSEDEQNTKAVMLCSFEICVTRRPLRFKRNDLCG
jgi:hypothetical protein